MAKYNRSRFLEIDLVIKANKKYYCTKHHTILHIYIFSSLKELTNLISLCINLEKSHSISELNNFFQSHFTLFSTFLVKNTFKWQP